MADGQIQELEALVRWNHPHRGLVPARHLHSAGRGYRPDRADRQLGAARGLRPLREWQTRYPAGEPLVMSVNLSARQFESGSLADEIRGIVKESGIDPHTLKLEITESVVMRNAQNAIATLVALKGLGIQLAIDDFGTGYSSLSYLKRFPVDTLKIDRSFVDGLGTDPQDTAIVGSVIALARSLDLSLTAEGIEN